MRHNSFLGLTWDHPRGYRALEAAAALDKEQVISWTRQPLEGFESHPIADLASRHDLLVFDHPHVGEALAENCLQPIDDWFGKEEIKAWADRTIGRALDSYCWERRCYGLPLDVATQVMARNPDILPDTVPDTWDDVLRLSETHPVVLSLAGPHAILTFFSLCLALGEEPGSEHLISDATGREALDRMRRLAENAPAGTESLNPIGLLEALASRSGIALVPLVYGYVNYAVARPGRGRVAFSEAPRVAAGGCRGSVLGGTGIGITRRAEPTADLLERLRWLISEDAQVRFIPDHDGQPSARSAWCSAAVNDARGGFYQATIETTEHAWVRPRFDGYIAFQKAASATLRDALIAGHPSPEILAQIRTLWRAALSAARRPLLSNIGLTT
ncbi:hypothetical protein AA309_12970 [Microvirga vignae]|uniref:ABC transporter substrate-binding protein n=1 Tax=Microvirga vignae TaxID=1225564 RepID=A0A0H1RCL6_9HYPH|nr:extracellular solute-binding protein [Microvirga vignae]KLK92611.1 hypothetical protein AA309_12970 [Microvirga vignae]